ncbi:hypothetical protein ILYODFUR_018114 [Ilyodon furcidens]|uniref:Uncharacterized protein n=1 Tax=Ilyodon furcidens TaxID=33524 RepID=A0ABV0VG57_9TELE
MRGSAARRFVGVLGRTGFRKLELDVQTVMFAALSCLPQTDQQHISVSSLLRVGAALSYKQLPPNRQEVENNLLKKIKDGAFCMLRILQRNLKAVYSFWRLV